MNMAQFGRSARQPTELTEKQREVLDLLIMHKTSKEIARDLGISPHTVEQRIRNAKSKLGVERRSDLAGTYRLIRSIYKQSVYEESGVELLAIPLRSAHGPSEALGLVREVETDHNSSDSELSAPSHPVRLVPAMFEGRTGTWLRVGAVFAIAAGTIMVVLVGLAVFEQLSRLLG